MSRSALLLPGFLLQCKQGPVFVAHEVVTTEASIWTLLMRHEGAFLNTFTRACLCTQRPVPGRALLSQGPEKVPPFSLGSTLALKLFYT